MRAIPARYQVDSVFACAFCLIVCWAMGCSRSQPAARVETRPTDAPPPKPQPWFEEVAAKSGVTFWHSSGHTTRLYMPEIKSGGVGLLDYDRDGLLDILCVNGGSLDPSATNRPGPRLYHNLGHWKFEDVTERAGISNL